MIVGQDFWLRFGRVMEDAVHLTAHATIESSGKRWATKKHGKPDELLASLWRGSVGVVG